MFHRPKKETPHLLAVILHSPLPQPLANTNLLSFPMDLPIIMDILYKWNHTVWALLHLASFM